MIVQGLYRGFIRLLFPDLAREMAEEGVFVLDLSNPVGSLEEADFIRIEDNGADVTIFAFSGPDVLYAGHSKHHFMGVVKRLARKFGGANFVFLSDCQRMGFMTRPDGQPGGLEFYSDVVKETMKRLNASHNVGIGSSFGGSAAHVIGYECGFQQIITFSAVFTADSYLSLRSVLKTIFNIRGLYVEPRGYLEILIVTLSTSYFYNQIKRRLGRESIVDVVGLYRALEKKPLVSLYYGQYAPPDAAQVVLMRDFPEVKTVPVPTGRHNTPGFLYRQGTLGQVIAEDISAAL